MIYFIDFVKKGFMVLRQSVSRRALKETGAALATTWPLITRQLRRNLLRNAVIALIVAVSTASYLLVSMAYGGASELAYNTTRPLDLPVDAIAWTDRAGTSIERALNRSSLVVSYEPVIMAEVYTPFGRATLLGVGSDSALAIDSSVPVSTVAANLKGPAAIIPAAWGRESTAQGLTGLTLEDSFEISFLDNKTGGWYTRTFRVAGYYDPGESPLSGPIVLKDEAEALVAGDAASPAAGTRAYLIDLKGPPGNTQRLEGFLGPDVKVLSRSASGRGAVALVAAALSPVRVVLLLVGLFTGLGILNVLMLSFLQRKPALGILKALGVDNREIQVLLLGEGMLTALLGLILGFCIAIVIGWYGLAAMGMTASISVSALVGAVIWALLIFYVASWLPTALCQRASVNTLLYNRRVYLNASSACAECGRCGGF